MFRIETYILIDTYIYIYTYLEYIYKLIYILIETSILQFFQEK